jgi:4-hydroxy-tetrahydrodipicolinate synthase
MAPFGGLSAFPVTPSDADGRVDTDRMGALVARLACTGLASIGVMGSTGGYPYFSVGERARAIAASVEAAGDVPVVAGIGALTTGEVLAHARAARDAGAQGLLLAPMSYLPLRDAEVLGLFREVAAATDLPICVYNNPTTTHFDISNDLLTALAGIDRVDAVKNPAAAAEDCAEQMAVLRRRVPTGFSLGYSGDALIANALGAGADGWYSVLAGVLPAPCLALWAARGDAAERMVLNARLGLVWEVCLAFGGIRVAYEIASRLGFGRIDLPRPLLPLTRDEVARVEAALIASDLPLDAAP